MTGQNLSKPPVSSRFMPEPFRPQQVSKSHFKAHALELFQEIEASGQPLVVTDHGRLTLEIRPYRPTDLPIDLAFSGPIDHSAALAGA